MNPCGRVVKRQPGDDPIPCGTRLWKGTATTKRTLEILLCNSCIQEQKDEERILEEATKP